MTIILGLDNLNILYDKYKDYFDYGSPSFHNLLWQFIINRVRENEDMIFHTDIGFGQQQVVMIHKEQGGYIRTGVHFKEGVSYHDAAASLTEINEVMFGVTNERQGYYIGDAISLSRARHVDVIRTPENNYIWELIDRKRDGIDCSEEESAEIKMWIKETLISVADDSFALEHAIQTYFPLEYGEAVDERDGGE